MALDMEQLRKMFYEECRENLEVLENVLLHLDPQQADDETINTIFRAAHSIKGGAATFNLLDISEFTHSVEAYLDLVRNHQTQLSSNSVDVLLKSCDMIRELLHGHEQGSPCDTAMTHQVGLELSALLKGTEHQTGQSGQQAATPLRSGSDSSAHSAPGEWQLQFVPHRELFFSGNDPLRILRELQQLDPQCQLDVDSRALPELLELEPELCYLAWRIRLSAALEESDIREIFEWVEDECDLHLNRIASELPGSEDMAAGDNDAQGAASSSTPAVNTAGDLTRVGQVEEGAKVATPDVSAAAKVSAAPILAAEPVVKAAVKPVKSESSVTSIRVDIDKVDSLINLVGELVITQSMLTEIGNDFSMDKLEKLKSGLAQLLQNSKDLQENVLNIRMLPMSFAFSRFPRLVRDLCGRLEKKVELKIEGENTELDKTVLERIVDPLVHLVRNGIDHGIEQPHQRLQAGKSETGCVELKAYHQGGSIVIEVKDDGAGIDCERIWRKAVEKGVLPADSRREDISDKQVMSLIFAPGFSTAEQVSDISGRGVGMDVVKRNIEELGGHIELDSELGRGSHFTINLPLTLAILDGQLVKVGQEVYIIPLLTIIESIQINPACVKLASGGVELYRLREDNIPILRLQDELEMGASGPLDKRLLCFVEAAGNRVGLLVDELLDQQQVVIKSLESNYAKVAGISGATILGDGSVSLILDIQGLITNYLKRRSQTQKVIAA
ncbi:chemotaxis protein CheA [Vibrio sp. ABG19]|uniref:chemotaxis protein CheA n=1 Tax=Vibrio sp. ABG19 TaxID=2817385 RepID=UPI00249E911B|nr:chemotaxis protein CheA [Vibrio sp. ABG19]WGY45627.1 chemotaxis protein CheA [Vibrio sp. ABG19]